MGFYNNAFDEYNIDNVSNSFLKVISRRDQIIEQFNAINLKSDFITEEYEKPHRIITSDSSELILPFIFKWNPSGCIPIVNYVPRHLYSSIIKVILLEGSGSLDTRINKAIYLLYHYWFYYKSEQKEIVHNVCVDIENMIALLIDNGLTTYKDYTSTGELVDALRYRLRSEKLLESIS